jgi:hypothetical protein
MIKGGSIIFPRDDPGGYIMEQKNVLTKILAIVGTVLVWFPILAPILLALSMFSARGRFLFDYLMPMELFLFAFIGSGLLLWATLRAHSRVKFIASGIGIAVAMFFGVEWFAVITGLASGEREPVGWVWNIAIAALVVYIIGVLLVGMGGVLLLRDLFKKRIAAA